MLGLVMSAIISVGTFMLAVHEIITVGEQVIATILGWILMVLINKKG